MSIRAQRGFDLISSLGWLPAAVGGALVLALAGCGHSSTYALMQMNLCLSGLAGCHGKARRSGGRRGGGRPDP